MTQQTHKTKEVETKTVYEVQDCNHGSWKTFLIDKDYNKIKDTYDHNVKSIYSANELRIIKVKTTIKVIDYSNNPDRREEFERVTPND